MDTLLIPCYDRPELLHETLRNLMATGDMDTVLVCLKPDNGHSADIHRVVRMFDIPNLVILRANVSRYRMTRQSQNVLEGYIHAAQVSTGLVYMVEEDVQVSTDFFRYHRGVFAQNPDAFASLSTKNHNRTVTVTDGPGAYYLSSGDYCSLGVCMQASTITEHIAPHLNERYLRDCMRYCELTFPPGIPRGHAEQDGLIRRIQLATGKPTAYPHVPRAFHAGWYGYNRKRSPLRGTLDQKIATVQGTIYDKDKARAAAISPAWALDSEPVNLNTPPWTQLNQVNP